MVQSTPLINIGKPRVSRIDMNISTQEPFINAARELFGEHGCYPLLAVGTFGEKSGFKMYADVMGINPQVANDITTEIDRYNEAVKEAEDDDKDSISIEDYITNPYHLKLFKTASANVSNYVIVDDRQDMQQDQLDHFVHVNAYRGFTNEDLEKAIAILNK